MGGGVPSGEMNHTIQQYLGSFARESFGKACSANLAGFFLFHMCLCIKCLLVCLCFYSHFESQRNLGRRNKKVRT